MFNFLKVHQKQMLNEKVGVHQSVAHDGEWADHHVGYEVGELICSRNSEGLGVHPHHRQFVEKHF
jgi:hypothetical protein